VIDDVSITELTFGKEYLRGEGKKKFIQLDI